MREVRSESPSLEATLASRENEDGKTANESCDTSVRSLMSNVSTDYKAWKASHRKAAKRASEPCVARNEGHIKSRRHGRKVSRSLNHAEGAQTWGEPVSPKRSLSGEALAARALRKQQEDARRQIQQRLSSPPLNGQDSCEDMFSMFSWSAQSSTKTDNTNVATPQQQQPQQLQKEENNTTREGKQKKDKKHHHDRHRDDQIMNNESEGSLHMGQGSNHRRRSGRLSLGGASPAAQLELSGDLHQQQEEREPSGRRRSSWFLGGNKSSDRSLSKDTSKRPGFFRRLSLTRCDSSDSIDRPRTKFFRRLSAGFLSDKKTADDTTTTMDASNNDDEQLQNVLRPSIFRRERRASLDESGRTASSRRSRRVFSRGNLFRKQSADG